VLNRATPHLFEMLVVLFLQQPFVFDFCFSKEALPLFTSQNHAGLAF
jgi:hypothetical protein